MPPTPFAEIVCTKCGAKFTTVGYACSTCQSALVKVCGNCGFHNAVAKNYCDQCGTPLPLAPAPGTSPDAIPQTAVRSSGKAPKGPAPKITQPPPGGFAVPSAGRMERPGPAYVPAGNYVPPPPPTEASLTHLRRRDSWQKLYFWMPLFLIAGAAAYLYYDYYKPTKAIPRATAKYLDALSHLDFPTAYGLLSQKAQAHCTLEEFRNLREPKTWTWSDVQIVRLEPEAAVVKYRLSVENQPPTDDFIIFLLENGQWVRPYNWNLLHRAEDAFSRNDPDMALILAQEAVRINPRDPMARGYMCEAVYYRRVPAETANECALALQLSETYPSKLSPKSLYHLHAILGDTYKNSLAKYPEALAQYDALLAFPNLSAADKCDLFLARADTRIAMGRAAEADPDFQAAAAACVKPDDLNYIRKRQAGLAPPR